MIRTRRGKVIKVLKRRTNLTEILVEVEGFLEKAINYDDLTGEIREGAEVILNTTALRLALGTGGRHFVMHVLGKENLDISSLGHIMKLRYTPWQIKCLAVEEKNSFYREKMEQFTNLGGMPVVIAPLHSLVPLIVAAFQQALGGKGKVAYLMTDGAALPLAFSELVYQLQGQGLIQKTITVGHAFGGDLEAVNIYTGLIAAYQVAEADMAVVAMGPGIVGTGSQYGFTGIEQGEIVNSVNILGGRPIAVPRLSFADTRERHQGISHHTLTSLGKIALTPALLPLPKLEKIKMELLQRQLSEADIFQKHQVIEIEDTSQALQLLEQLGIRVTTMGRGPEEEKEFFQAGAVAGLLAANLAGYLLAPAR